MGNLNIGKDVVSIRDAVRQVEKNIAELQQSKSKIQGYAAHAIAKFYDDKISMQQATLSWLNRAL